MTRNSIPAIRRELQSLKRLIPANAICFTFLEETDKENVFVVKESIYRSRADPQFNRYEMTAATIQEAAKQYRFPADCDRENSILFTYDFGE